jgi:hypothetical protein
VNTSKSLRIILLAAIAAVTPLESHSYEKMRVGAPVGLTFRWAISHRAPTRNSFNSNHLTQFQVGPPHVTPLFSYGCRKWVGRGVARFMRPDVFGREGRFCHSPKKIHLFYAALAEPEGLRLGVVVHSEVRGLLSSATVARLAFRFGRQSVGVMAQSDSPFCVGFGEGHWALRYHQAMRTCSAGL